ncbi:hypothetical protein TRIP_D410049 [uncultured Paludibacter sp.]|uniref:Uncharacterized protein n=1 Tax=uncultured Paludibacter sp. TaxID=497635 RepID=A0A653AFG5_9BACT|nr:hypothetical protein TRIP_D410049 [uncultured Paludibacter sp.]
MYQFFLIKNTNQKLAVKNKREIVSKMRQHEWDGHSTNSDYMHVFAFRNKEGFPEIRFQNEEEFIEDLEILGIIERVRLVRFVRCLIKSTWIE